MYDGLCPWDRWEQANSHDPCKAHSERRMTETQRVVSFDELLFLSGEIRCQTRSASIVNDAQAEDASASGFCKVCDASRSPINAGSPLFRLSSRHASSVSSAS